MSSAGTERRPHGFTLIELMVVMGVIGALVSLLIPAISRAIAQSNLISCMSRERQLTLALISYAASNHAKFPPNTSVPSPGSYWNDADLLGIDSDTNYTIAPGTNVGTIFTCPCDRSSVRTYAMNYWASSSVYIPTSPSSIAATVARRGIFWNYTVRRPSSMLLLSETWSGTLVQNGIYRCANTIGYAGDSPAARFGANGGFSPPLPEGPWGTASVELAYVLHRTPSTGPNMMAKGRINIAFADGHVSTEATGDLVNSTGQLTGAAYWSPLDYLGQ